MHDVSQQLWESEECCDKGTLMQDRNKWRGLQYAILRLIYTPKPLLLVLFDLLLIETDTSLTVNRNWQYVL